MTIQDLFRRRALEHAEHGSIASDVIRLTPAWTRWAYWILVLAFSMMGSYGWLAQVYDYAVGPAIIWKRGDIELRTNVAGTIAAIETAPGEHIEQGQLVVRLHAARELGELQRIGKEFDLQLVMALRDPADVVARQALASLNAQRDLAAIHLDELAIRAPYAGTIGDIRVRSGQSVAAGDVIATLDRPNASCTVLALLPGQYRPELAVGAALRFELAGFRYAHQQARIEGIGTQVIGPAEAKRYLGSEIADSVVLDGPIVLARAVLPSCELRVGEDELHLYQGMGGRAEVRVKRESLWTVLFPGLRQLLRRFHV